MAGSRVLFTENESNAQRLFGSPNESPYVKDAFHHYIVNGRKDAVRRDEGTKATALYVLDLPAAAECFVDLRLTREDEALALPLPDFEQVFAERKTEAECSTAKIPENLPAVEQAISRQAYAGLCGPSSSITTSFRTGSTAMRNCRCRLRFARSGSIATGRICSAAMC